MMMMVAKVFVDTNILLRSIHQSASQHLMARQLVEQYHHDRYELWINRQVIREYLVQVTRIGVLSTPLDIVQTIQRLHQIEFVYHIADETYHVTKMLKFLMQQFPIAGKQIHDANIVATMLTYEIDTLLTLNVNDMKRFSSQIKIVTIS